MLNSNYQISQSALRNIKLKIVNVYEYRVIIVQLACSLCM